MAAAVLARFRRSGAFQSSMTDERQRLAKEEGRGGRGERHWEAARWPRGAREVGEGPDPIGRRWAAGIGHGARGRCQGRGGDATCVWASPQCQAFESIQIGQLNSNEFEFESNMFELHLIQIRPSLARKIQNMVLKISKR
jgi:hypothetical protein